jgi:DNA-binding transcriptional LysR family regulator
MACSYKPNPSVHCASIAYEQVYKPCRANRDRAGEVCKRCELAFDGKSVACVIPSWLRPIVSNQLSTVSVTLRLSAHPTISDTLLTPIVTAFQASYPDVWVQVFFAEGIDLAFRLGVLWDSSLFARKVLAYRRQLVASPDYLNSGRRLKRLATCSTIRCSRSGAASQRKLSWRFEHKDGRAKETITFRPYLTMNDFAGLTPALLAGRGSSCRPWCSWNSSARVVSSK